MIPIFAIKLLLPKTPSGDVKCWSKNGISYLSFVNDTHKIDVILPAFDQEEWAGSLHMYALNRKGFQSLCATKGGLCLSTKAFGKTPNLSDVSSPIIASQRGYVDDTLIFPHSGEICGEEADLVLYNSGSDFRKRLDSNLYAVANSGYNESIMNTLVHVTESKVHLVSTDGHRLHKNELAAGDYCLRLEGEEHLRTVSGKIMNIFSMIPGARLMLSKSPTSGTEVGAIVFDSGINGINKKCEIRFQSLSSVSFPRYQHVIPYTDRTTFSCKVKPLIKATKQAAKLSSNDIMHFVCEGDTLKLKVSVSREGDDTEFAEFVVGEALIENKFNYPIAVKPRYFIEALNGFDSVSVTLTGSLNPVVIKDVKDNSQNDKADNLALVMPIRL
jgi:DNA polymerase III sliding clamp (beta) subunit (PCNA family)